MEKQTYTVVAEGFLDGTFRRKGEEMDMTAAQAGHLLIVGQIKLKDSKPVAPASRNVPVKVEDKA